VTTALGTVLGQAAAEALASTLTKNPEAYDFYLKAQGVRIIGTGRARARATYYQQAVALGSHCTRVWGGLAMTLCNLYADGTRDAAVGRRAKEALDPKSIWALNNSAASALSSPRRRGVYRHRPFATSDLERFPDHVEMFI